MGGRAACWVRVGARVAGRLGWLAERAAGWPSNRCPVWETAPPLARRAARSSSSQRHAPGAWSRLVDAAGVRQGRKAELARITAARTRCARFPSATRIVVGPTHLSGSAPGQLRGRGQVRGLGCVGYGPAQGPAWAAAEDEAGVNCRRGWDLAAGRVALARISGRAAFVLRRRPRWVAHRRLGAAASRRLGASQSRCSAEVPAEGRRRICMRPQSGALWRSPDQIPVEVTADIARYRKHPNGSRAQRSNDDVPCRRFRHTADKMCGDVRALRRSRGVRATPGPLVARRANFSPAIAWRSVLSLIESHEGARCCGVTATFSYKRSDNSSPIWNCRRI